MSSVARLDHFGFLAITGKDAAKFLQGYATCDFEDISDTRAAIGATCNLQGRMVASFLVLGIEDGYLLRMPRERIEPLMSFLSKYIVFSKAEMTDRSDALTCFGVIGETPDFPEVRGDSTIIGDAHVTRVSDAPRFEVWTTDSGYTLEHADRATTDDWIAAEVDDGIAWVTDPTAEEFIPQMFGYHEIGAIDFEKGCYLGQEIVARMHYRGTVNRVIHRGSTGESLAPGDELKDAGGKSVGVVVSSAREADRARFLAVMQFKKETTPESFTAGGEALELERVSYGA